MNGYLGIMDQKKVDAILEKPQSTWTDEECTLIRILQEYQLQVQQPHAKRESHD